MRARSWVAVGCFAALIVAGMVFAVVPPATSSAHNPLVRTSVADRRRNEHAPLDWMRPAREVPHWFVTADEDVVRARADNAPGTELAWKSPSNVTPVARAVENGTPTRYLVRPHDRREAGWVPASALRLGGPESKARDILEALPERVPLFEQ